MSEHLDTATSTTESARRVICSVRARALTCRPHKTRRTSRVTATRPFTTHAGCCLQEAVINRKCSRRSSQQAQVCLCNSTSPPQLASGEAQSCRSQDCCYTLLLMHAGLCEGVFTNTRSGQVMWELFTALLVAVTPILLSCLHSCCELSHTWLS